MKYWLCLLIAFACFNNLSAQEPVSDSSSWHLSQPGYEKSTVNSLFTVRNIVITGNKKTRDKIILREIPFKPDEEYLLQELVKKFEDARRQLMNTSLFNEVTVALKSFEGYNVDVLIDVKERWYIFPVPYFKPVDRNINQWIIEQKASLSRVNYGIKFLYNNISGQNDKFKLYLINGYTKQISFKYQGLFFDKKLRWGFNTRFEIGKNHEVNYNTINNKQVFVKDNSKYLRNFIHAIAEVSYRRATKTFHNFGIGYTREAVSDTIVKLNPSYFKSGFKSVQFPEIFYNMMHFNVDYIPYPTKGYAAAVSISKKGLNRITNLWELYAKGFASWHITPKAYFNLNAFGIIKLPFKQSYFNQRLLGYNEEFMQGYEYYVIDGVAGIYLKATLARELLKFNIRIPVKRGKEPVGIPFRIFGKIYGNAGYVHNPEPGSNFLSNKMLSSGGIGLDIVTFYDVTMKIEWSFNQLGQNGLFLHRKTIF